MSTTIAHPPGSRVRLQEVEHRYAASGTIIKNLNLTIEPGEFVALIGPSGCGKSTLLRLMAGLEKVSGGRLEVTKGKSSFATAFVFQEAHLLPWRTVLGNVCLPLELIGQSAASARSMALTALAEVDLESTAHLFPNQLSGGMKMRVSLARSLVTQPSLLLLDEPFAALDEDTRFKLQEQLRRLWAKLKMTVVFVTHSLGEAAFLADRTLVLSSLPANLLLDRTTQLPPERDASTRTDPRLLNEIRALSEAAKRNRKESP